MAKIEFIKDFATKKTGDNFECDSMLASQLVNVDKVAKYIKDESKPSNTKKSNTK